MLKRLGTICVVYIVNPLANGPQGIGRTEQFLACVLDNEVSQRYFFVVFWDFYFVEVILVTPG